jgi:hypothetical protein
MCVFVKIKLPKIERGRQRRCKERERGRKRERDNIYIESERKGEDIQGERGENHRKRKK